MESFRFSKEAILALPIPARRTRYADAKQPGLIVALTPGGARVYYVFKRSRGKLHEERVGDATLMTVEIARERARAILADLDQGRLGRCLLDDGDRDPVPAGEQAQAFHVVYDLRRFIGGVKVVFEQKPAAKRPREVVRGLWEVLARCAAESGDKDSPRVIDLQRPEVIEQLTDLEIAGTGHSPSSGAQPGSDPGRPCFPRGGRRGPARCL